MPISFYAVAPGALRPINFDAEPLTENSVNLHNGGACAVLMVMGLISSESALWDSPPVPIGEFRQACLKGSSEKRVSANVEEPYEDKSPGRCQVVNFGLSAQYIETRITMLAEWAERMQAAGATEVYWG